MPARSRRGSSPSWPTNGTATGVIPTRRIHGANGMYTGGVYTTPFPAGTVRARDSRTPTPTSLTGTIESSGTS